MWKLIFFPALLFSSLSYAAPLAWTKEAVAQIKAAKTVKELLCHPSDAEAGRELCALYTPDHGKKLDFKLEMINDSTLIFSDKSLTVKVERTGVESETLINGHLVKLEKSTTQLQLKQAIAAALRPASAFFPALIDTAVADTITRPNPAIALAIQHLLVLEKGYKNGANYTLLKKTCMQDAQEILDYFKKGHGEYRKGTAKDKVRIRKNFKILTQKLGKAGNTISINYNLLPESTGTNYCEKAITEISNAYKSVYDDVLEGEHEALALLNKIDGNLQKIKEEAIQSGAISR